MKKNYLFILCMIMPAFAMAQWDLLHDMNIIRTQHVTVNLGGNKLLAAGGWDLSSTNLVSAEVYDNSTDTWTMTGNNMSSAHTTGAAVKLNDGTVLVMGGYDGSTNVTACDIYNPVTDTWTATGSLNTGRSYHTATLLGSGNVLVVGGYDGSTNLNTCEIYNPATGMWTMADSMNIGRSYHTATLLNDGKVLIAGGYNPAVGFQLYSVEIYNPSGDTWTTANDMSAQRSLHSASLMADGKVMVAGGESYTGGSPYAYDGLKTAEVFDPSTGNWTSIADMPAGLCYNKQFTLVDSRVLVIAGKSHTDYGAGFTSAPGVTYLYYPSSDSWGSLPMNIDARLNFAADVMDDGAVVVTGGDDNTAEKFRHFLGIDQVDNKDLYLQVFPNPSVGVFNISVPTNEKIVSIQVFDLSGKQIHDKTNLGVSVVQLDLTGAEAGLYTVKVKTTHQTLLSKLLLAH